MKLPYCENCFVPKNKITKYLLNERHLGGRGKAIFFLKMGFTKDFLKFLEKN